MKELDTSVVDDAIFNLRKFRQQISATNRAAAQSMDEAGGMEWERAISAPAEPESEAPAEPKAEPLEQRDRKLRAQFELNWPRLNDK